MKFALLLAASLLTGCAASGVQVSPEAAMQFKEGSTTEAQIVAKLGSPNGTTFNSGNKTIYYSGTQAQVNAATFIPIVGMFAGGSTYSLSMVSYQLDSDGVLQKVYYSTQNGTSRMGSSPAQMTAVEPTAIK
jgi:outer membrane protein assembly factor BamE (lipoprotein component of BamABCDE complex)